jgi:outer membrane biogenesis lipoprotein LolB|tara:strand:- start:321 stop:527 length:207 start_codon:yes stop_codon:yes gene_type:complete
MHLKAYLNNKNIAQKEFIKKVEEKTGHKIPQGTLAKWILGTRIPRKKDMLNIYLCTQKEVEPNDFYLG